MKKFRLDDHTALTGGTGQWLGSIDGFGGMIFFVERLDTGDTYEIRQGRGGLCCYGTPDYEWINIIGEGQRKVALLAMRQQIGRLRKSDLVEKDGETDFLTWPVWTM